MVAFVKSVFGAKIMRNQGGKSAKLNAEKTDWTTPGAKTAATSPAARGAAARCRRAGARDSLHLPARCCQHDRGNDGGMAAVTGGHTEQVNGQRAPRLQTDSSQSIRYVRRPSAHRPEVSLLLTFALRAFRAPHLPPRRVHNLVLTRGVHDLSAPSLLCAPDEPADVCAARGCACAELGTARRHLFLAVLKNASKGPALMALAGRAAARFAGAAAARLAGGAAAGRCTLKSANHTPICVPAQPAGQGPLKRAAQHRVQTSRPV